MKLTWFHLMPYTELPENFRGKHPSVWIDVHWSMSDPKVAEADGAASKGGGPGFPAADRGGMTVRVG
jgi:hypothetical protein